MYLPVSVSMAVAVAGDVTHYGFNIVIVLYCLQLFQLHSLLLYFFVFYSMRMERRKKMKKMRRKTSVIMLGGQR